MTKNLNLGPYALHTGNVTLRIWSLLVMLLALKALGYYLRGVRSVIRFVKRSLFLNKLIAVE